MTQQNGGGGAKCSIQPSDNGPLLIRGPVTLIDADGNRLQIKSRNVALCRCGASQNKPFCDRSHVRIGFRSLVRSHPDPVPPPEGGPTDH